MSAPSSNRWYTLPNLVTLVRLLVAPALALAILAGAWATALALFAGACLSDFADGIAARRFGQSSPMGGLFDHATDATLVASGLAALAIRGVVPWLLPPLVVAAFLQYALDSRVLAGRGLRGSGVGRWNGIAYYVLLGTPLVRDVVGVFWPWDGLVRVVGWLLVATTLASMALRLRALVAGKPARTRPAGPGPRTDTPTS